MFCKFSDMFARFVTPTLSVNMQMKKSIHERLKVLVADRVKARKAAEEEGKEEAATTFLDAVLDLHNESVDSNLGDLAKIMLLFLFGAREPVGYTCAWALQFLSSSPDALALLKVRFWLS